MPAKLEVSYQKMDKVPDAEDYLEGKLERHKALLDETSKIRATFRNNETRKFFTVSLNVNMPGGVIWVEEKDPDLRAAIDKVTALFETRIKRYRDKQSEWRGKSDWRHVEVPAEEFSETPEVIDYTPRVKTMNRYRSERAISTGEAIETMELLGAPCYLFKEIGSGKLAVVYRLEENIYGITYQAK